MTSPSGRSAAEPLLCAGALIVDDDGRIFVQRRSAQRRLFPDTWDIVGGHVEAGESVEDALHREVREETGWILSHVLATVGEHTWKGDDGLYRLETDFLCRVDGDLSRPRLEPGKHTDFAWITEAELDLLDENRPDDDTIRRIVADGFAMLRVFGF
ncbi:NUDIX hydrolase [Catenuloplanes atrovinosus]|uniref:8-oxo-dGTP pyrophosphatase MutT (NUDIX family) n=1 Tax=Catenuloplanes atrovinosus TaxID=137266 RepID=A0AAE3YVF7_9ACTN|nr:NUDIX domain-containing protein [Catenuloplanes atrovinosus]MDR7279937.1 8-oxo-dGTP pyrophosphatase MutT (NUDIX family) [Catenuloplanes atrovinosus]